MGFGTFSNGGLSFGVAFTLDDQFSGVSQRIQSSMDQMGGATDRIADKINASFNKIQAGVGLITTGVGLLAPVGIGVKYAGEFEQAELGLMTFLKTQEAAHAAFMNIKADAAKTPFETQPLLAANSALISTGRSAEAARRTVNNLANAVAATDTTGQFNATLARVSVNMQQIANAGTASAADIKQFAYAGINIYELLGRAAGKSAKDMMQVPVTYEMLDKALELSAQKGGMYEGAMERLSKSVNGKFSTISDGIKFSLASIGETVLPLLHPVLDIIISLTDWFQEFAHTGLGKFVIYAGIAILAIIALTLVGVGLVMVIEAIGAAIGTVLIEVLPFILLIGILVAALWGAYEAINSNNKVLVTLGTLLLVSLGPWGILAAAIMYVVRAKREFDAYMEHPLPMDKYTPVQQFFIKFGALLKAIGEMFTFSNAKDGIGMTEELTNKLRDMGLLETARDIGTWIVRLKEFFKGVWEGIKSGWGTIKSIGRGILNALEPVIDLLGEIGLSFNKNTSDIEKWKQVGEWVGIAIMTILFVIIGAIAIMTAAWIINGIAMLISWLPVILIIGVVIAIIWGIIWVVQHFGEIWDAVSTWISNKWYWVLGRIGEGFAWLLAQPARLFAAGVAIVQNIWDGVSSMWDSFMGWLDEKITAMVDKIKGAWDWVGDQASGAWDWATGGGSKDGGGGINPSSNTPYGNPRGIGGAIARGKGNAYGGMQPVVLSNTTQQVSGFTLNTYLDGEKIASNTMDRQKLKEARKND